MLECRVTAAEREEARAWRRRIREDRVRLLEVLQAERPDDPMARLLAAPIDPVSEREMEALRACHEAVRLHLVAAATR